MPKLSDLFWFNVLEKIICESLCELLSQLLVARIYFLIDLLYNYGEIADLTASRSHCKQTTIEQDQYNNELTVISLRGPVRNERYQGTKVTPHTLSRHTHWHTRHVTCARSHTRTTLSERTGPRSASELRVALRRVLGALRAPPPSYQRREATCGGTATHRLPHNLAAYSYSTW